MQGNCGACELVGDLLFFCLQIGVDILTLLGSLQAYVAPFGRGSCLIVWKMGCL